jgi:DNA repair protein RadC
MHVNTRNKPVNRLIDKGAYALSDIELLSIIISNGVSDDSAMDISAEVLKSYCIGELGCVSPEALQSIYGIGKAKSGQISAVFELAKRYTYESGFGDCVKLGSPELVYKYLYPKVMGHKKEMFFLLMLDTKNCLIKEEIVSIGSLNANVVHPREVFKSAILNSTAAIVIAHNHPSGDPNPSQNDVEITRRIVETGRLVGIEVLDHIIVGGTGGYLSMKESDLM